MSTLNMVNINHPMFIQYKPTGFDDHGRNFAYLFKVFITSSLENTKAPSMFYYR